MRPNTYVIKVATERRCIVSIAPESSHGISKVVSMHYARSHGPTRRRRRRRHPRW